MSEARLRALRKIIGHTRKRRGERFGPRPANDNGVAITISSGAPRNPVGTGPFPDMDEDDEDEEV